MPVHRLTVQARQTTPFCKCIINATLPAELACQAYLPIFDDLADKGRKLFLVNARLAGRLCSASPLHLHCLLQKDIEMSQVRSLRHAKSAFNYQKEPIVIVSTTKKAQPRKHTSLACFKRPTGMFKLRLYPGYNDQVTFKETLKYTERLRRPEFLRRAATMPSKIHLLSVLTCTQR